MIEAGVPGYEAYTFSLILGPPGMPQEVVDTLDKACRTAMADPATIKFLEGNASIPTPDTTPGRTGQFIRDELAKWAPIIRDADVKIA
jgi:tripartite-type tricarboxylate transporter receptor subunit TctC